MPNILVVDVQHAAGNHPTALPAFASDPQAGDTIVVGLASWDPAAIVAPTDSAGNAYTLIGTIASPANITVSLWVAQNILGGAAFVVTNHQSASSSTTDAVAWLLRGVAAAAYNADWHGASAAGPPSAIASGLSTLTPPAGSLFLGVAADAGAPGTGWNTTGVHGFTATLAGRAAVSNGTFTLASAYQISSVAASAPFAAGATYGWAALVASFAPIPPPTLTYVTPTTSLLAGGAAFTIRGTGFAGDATVDVGGVAAGSVVVHDPTTITGTWPAHAAGAVTIGVTNVAAADGVGGVGFLTYVAAISTTLELLLAGDPTSRVRVAGLTIHDTLNASPNTADLTIDSPAPVGSETLRIAVGDRLLFAGQLQTTDLSYEGWVSGDPRPVYPCSAIDDTARFNRRRPFGSWVATSATTVAGELAGTFAPSFFAIIEAGLPLITISFDGSGTLSEAIAAIATRVGGYSKVDDGYVFLFLTDTADPPDDLDSTPGRFLADPPIRLSTDTSQQRTRVAGQGRGTTVLVDIATGDTTIPIDRAVFTPGGGLATTGSQVIAYTDVDAGDGRTVLIDPGDNGSLSAPTVAMPTPRVSGAMAWGNYTYALAVVTPAGQDVPGTTGSGTIVPVGVGSGGSMSGVTVGGGTVPGGAYAVAMTWVTANGESGPLSFATITVVNPPNNAILYTAPGWSGIDDRITAVNCYLNGIGVGTITGSGGTLTLVSTPATVGPAIPGWNTSHEGGTLSLTGLAVSTNPAATGRILYRSRVNGTALFELATLDNTVTTYLDTTPDSGLGAPAPTVGSLGYAAGSTSLTVRDPSVLGAAGWIRVGGQLVHYPTIPATGPGSITAALTRGAVVEAVPALTGVSGLTAALTAGAAIHLWVVRNDLAAQSDQAAIDVVNGVVPPDGVIEGPPIVDDTLDEAGLIAVCDATLALYSRPIQTLTYACRDLKTKSGKPIVVDNPGGLAISTTLTIQAVTITELGLPDGTPPKFTVTASSVRFSLEDLLRRALAG